MTDMTFSYIYNKVFEYDDLQKILWTVITLVPVK